MTRYDLTFSVPWNVFLLTAGSLLCAVGVNGVIIHQHFLTGGLFGACLLLYYATGWLTPGLWYGLLNLPLFALGWVMVSRRFFFYSIYATAAFTLMVEFVRLDLGVHNQLYAAVAAGVLTGAGGGMILRSLGSAGGLDVVAVILFQRFNIGVGKFYFVFNALLFSLSLTTLEPDLFIASLILVFISSKVVDAVLALFSQRKVVLVISRHSREIAGDILEKLHIGATFLKGHGAWSGEDRDVLMTVINNIQLKRLEELVFSRDEQALFIVENTFNVLGTGFSRRKIY
ncbi:MAG: YitT family protein [Desulfovibrionaceae bacterium]